MSALYLPIRDFFKFRLVMNQNPRIFALPNDANGIGDKVERSDGSVIYKVCRA